jgi:glycosyltransferase involved in cell wall biosynthesis
MNPRIAIITPSYNQGKYIERAIQSVLSQDIEELEYVIVDGGSTDESLDIIERYGRAYAPKLRWTSSKDRGQADAVNKGIALTSAEIIGWLNSDDIYYENALSFVLECFDQNREVQVIYGDANHIDQDDVFIEKYPVEEWNWDRLLEVCFMSQPASFVRREAFRRCGLLDPNLRHSNDYELWIRFAKCGIRFARIPRLLAATRMHHECATLSAADTSHEEINDFMLSHFGKVPDQWIFNYAHAVARSKGYQDEDRWKFAMMISAHSIYAALRWNRSINRNIFHTVALWTIQNSLDGLLRFGRALPEWICSKTIASRRKY